MADPNSHLHAGVEQITLVELLDHDPPAAAPGSGADLFGRYRVLGLLGSGGMGAVYRVWDSVLEDEVALKMLKRELLSEPGVVGRFRQEVRLARRVTHPNVVRTFDLGEHDGDYYLTMEYVRGRSVRRILAEEGAFHVERALDVARQTAAGVAAAHAAGVLHCDLKPDNLLLDEGGRVAITDFGIARAMGGRDGIIAGTPSFMAPELAERGVAGAATDLYALGVVLFEIATGKNPWMDPELRRRPELRLLHAAPDPRQVARVQDALAEIILGLLAPLPEGRPVSAAEVVERLADIEASASRRGTPSPRGAVPAPGTPSLAVLPFHNAGAPEDAHLAEGLTEEIIDALSATRGLRVRPLSSTMGAQIEGGALGAGRALEVQAVVEGTVRRRAGEVVLAVRLIGVSDGFQLWARRFRCGTGDALMVADEVAQAVAGALTAELAQSSRVVGSDPVALELYLRARHLLRSGWDLGAGEAVALLEQALARRPDHPDALATYAMALARQAFFEQRTGRLLAETMEQVRHAANQAVRLAPDQGDAWLALANAQLYSGHVPEAARALLEAVRRAPGLFRAQQMLGSLSMEIGRTDAAIQHLQAALSIDPNGIQARMDLARGYALLGLWGQADEQLVGAARGTTAEEVRLLTLARLSLWAPGRTFETSERPLSGTAASQMVGQAIEGFRTIFEQGRMPPQLEEQAASPPANDLGVMRAVRGQLLAEMLGAVGKVDLAVGVLQGAVDAGLTDLLWLERCPVLAPLRLHPGWSNLHAVVAGRAATIRAALDGR